MRWVWAFSVALSTVLVVWAVWPSPAGTSRRNGAPGVLVGSVDSGTACLSNLKQYANGIGMYAADFDGHYPPAENWANALHSYVPSFGAEQCPGVKSFGYSFNDALGARRTNEIASPQASIAVFDSSVMAPNAHDNVTSLPNPPRHMMKSGERSNFAAYLDGHADRVRTKPIP